MKAVIALLTLMASMILTVFYLTFFEPPYLSYKNLPFEAPPTVVAGNAVPLHIIRCSTASTVQTYTIARSVENVQTKQSFVLKDNVVQVRPGCSDEISLVNVIPKEVPEGNYRIIGLAEIDGFMHQIHVPWYSVVFKVTPP